VLFPSRVAKTKEVSAWSSSMLANEDPRAFYQMLMAYYQNNGLYDDLMLAMYQLKNWQHGMKPLRNPANRVVEFYVAKLAPGALPDALPIVTHNERIIRPIQQVWEWSNLSARKQVLVRWLAIYGDGFIKVVSKRGDKVYLQLLEPGCVSDFSADHRGYLTDVRIDIPMEKKGLIHTEVWTKASYRVWEHRQGLGVETERLGAPLEETPLSEFGIDFIPIVHGKLRDIGEKRGVGAYALALDKIDEANRQATRLHQMIFRHNKANWALRANAQDASGRPLPPPSIDGTLAGNGMETLELGDETVLRLPGLSVLDSLVPQLDYGSALAILNAQMDEIEQDLPELAYYKLREKGDLSGRAVRALLSDAIDRLLEARGNVEDMLARADAMALTVGQAVGVFHDLGDYHRGDFKHGFARRDVIPLDELDKAEILQTETAAGLPLVTALRRVGMGEEEIRQVLDELGAEEARKQATLGQAMAAARRRFDRYEDGQTAGEHGA